MTARSKAVVVMVMLVALPSGYPDVGKGDMFLGIDLGTSEIKALLMDEDGVNVGTARCRLNISRPRPRWSEQSPEDWWQATLNVVDELRRTSPRGLEAVRGIGLSGQMHGAVLLDRRDYPLRAAILWNDTRSEEQCVELTERVPSLHAIAGNLAMPGFTAPKLLWVAQHEPETFSRIRTVLLPKDYLRLRLSGEKVSDTSDASGTLWLDVGARRWSHELLDATALTASQMPALVEGSTSSGQLRQELCDRWGMQHPVTIAGGAGDNAASAVGIGAVSPGDGFVSLGTSGVIFVVDDRFHPNPASAVHAFCHTLPNRWHRMSAMLSAASCLSWIAGVLGAGSETALLEEVGKVQGSEQGVPIFLPYLSGERTPHNDPHAQGVFFGLSHDTDRAALGRAVLEGVTFGLADGLDSLRKGSLEVASLSLVGGGARSSYWAQLLADVLDIPIRTLSSGDASAALGAARLAQLACGASEGEVCRKPAAAAEFLPRPESQPPLRQRLHQFRTLYTAVKPLFGG